MDKDLVFRLRERARIRRQITTRKSVQENKPDRIADLLEEAADELEATHKELAWLVTLGDVGWNLHKERLSNESK